MKIFLSVIAILCALASADVCRPRVQITLHTPIVYKFTSSGVLECIADALGEAKVIIGDASEYTDKAGRVWRIVSAGAHAVDIIFPMMENSNEIGNVIDHIRHRELLAPKVEVFTAMDTACLVSGEDVNGLVNAILFLEQHQPLLHNLVGTSVRPWLASRHADLLRDLSYYQSSERTLPIVTNAFHIYSSREMSGVDAWNGYAISYAEVFPLNNKVPTGDRLVVRNLLVKDTAIAPLAELFLGVIKYASSDVRVVFHQKSYRSAKKLNAGMSAERAGALVSLLGLPHHKFTGMIQDMVSKLKVEDVKFTGVEKRFLAEDLPSGSGGIGPDDCYKVVPGYYHFGTSTIPEGMFTAYPIHSHGDTETNFEVEFDGMKLWRRAYEADEMAVESEDCPFPGPYPPGGPN